MAAVSSKMGPVMSSSVLAVIQPSSGSDSPSVGAAFRFFLGLVEGASPLKVSLLGILGNGVIEVQFAQSVAGRDVEMPD